MTTPKQQQQQQQQPQQQQEQQRVLSIQSHVVHGYVGNKAAVFPLQLLGFDVDVVNSVHFSNHTGYPGKWEGTVVPGEQLLSLLQGLQRNQLLHNVGHLLTGYIGSESFLRAVLVVLTDIRQHHPCRFVCDPVLGDAGTFYVPRELVQVYRDLVIPHANVVTPNQFEVEQLTGVVVTTIDDAKRACNILHAMGPSLVVITSIILTNNNNNNNNTNDNDDNKNTIAIIASQQQQQQQNDATEVWRIDSPLIPGHYTGTGDLCAALLLGHTTLHPNDLKGAMEKVISTMHAVIQRTMEASQQDGTGSIAARELKLIQSKTDIEHPPMLFNAYPI